MTHTNVAAIVANLVARPRARLVVVEHNQHSQNAKLKSGLVRLSYRMVPLVYPKADLVAAVSEGVRDDLAKVTGIRPERIAVLHNPVVDAGFEKSAVAGIDHAWLRSPGPPVVLGVGRFTRQKNFALLIEAFALARKSRPLRLIIEDVDLPGFDANPFRFMRHAAVYVLSSDWEGLPTTLIEAMACGTPVVSTDCESGPHEILLGGTLSRIVPVGDASALAGAILATLETPGDREARIARANDFSLNRAVDRYLEAAGWLQ
jgi:glycosyltransferase involved in cell wall biosynthesis